MDWRVRFLQDLLGKNAVEVREDFDEAFNLAIVGLSSRKVELLLYYYRDGLDVFSIGRKVDLPNNLVRDILMMTMQFLRARGKVRYFIEGVDCCTIKALSEELLESSLNEATKTKLLGLSLTTRQHLEVLSIDELEAIREFTPSDIQSILRFLYPNIRMSSRHTYESLVRVPLDELNLGMHCAILKEAIAIKTRKSFSDGFTIGDAIKLTIKDMRKSRYYTDMGIKTILAVFKAYGVVLLESTGCFKVTLPKRTTDKEIVDWRRKFLDDLYGDNPSVSVREDFDVIIKEVLKCVSEKEKAIFSMYYFQGKSTKAIASSLFLTSDYVSKLRSSGLRKIRQNIQYKRFFEYGLSHVLPTRTTNNTQSGISIEKLGLSPRVCNALARNGIVTIESLCEFSRVELLQVRGLGKVTVEEIENALVSYGLSFRK